MERPTAQEFLTSLAKNKELRDLIQKHPELFPECAVRPSQSDMFKVLKENTALREQLQAHPKLLQECLSAELINELPKDQYPSQEEVCEVLLENESLREQMQAHPELLNKCLSSELIEKLPRKMEEDKSEIKGLSQQDIFEVLEEDESLREQMQAHPELLAQSLSKDLIDKLSLTKLDDTKLLFQEAGGFKYQCFGGNGIIHFAFLETPQHANIEAFDEMIRVQMQKLQEHVAIMVSGLLPSVVKRSKLPFEDLGIQYVQHLRGMPSGMKPLFLLRRASQIYHIKDGLDHAACVIPIIKHQGFLYMLLFEETDIMILLPTLDHLVSHWQGSEIDQSWYDAQIDYEHIALRGLKAKTGINIPNNLVRYACESHKKTTQLFVPATTIQKTFVAYIDSESTKDEQSGQVQKWFRGIDTKIKAHKFTCDNNDDIVVHAVKILQPLENPEFPDIPTLSRNFFEWMEGIEPSEYFCREAAFLAFCACHPSMKLRIDWTDANMSECKFMKEELDGMNYVEHIPRDRDFFKAVIDSTTLTAQVDDTKLLISYDDLVKVPKRCRLVKDIPAIAKMMLLHILPAHSIRSVEEVSTMDDGSVVLDFDIDLEEQKMNFARVDDNVIIDCFQLSKSSEDRHKQNFPRDVFGNTPLHYAAANNRTAFATTWKKEHGTSHRNQFGMTACHVAVTHSHEPEAFLPFGGAKFVLIDTVYGKLGIFDYSCMMGRPLACLQESWKRYSVFGDDIQGLRDFCAKCPGAKLPAFAFVQPAQKP